MTVLKNIGITTMKTGYIKTIKKEFGFINSENEDIYFHFSGLIDKNVTQGDKVEFELENSAKKKGMFQAIKVKIIEKNKTNYSESRNSNDIINANSLLGKVKWFDSYKGFGVIYVGSSEYFFHKNSIKTKSHEIEKFDYVIFQEVESKKYEGKVDARNVYVIKHAEFTDSMEQFLSNELIKIKSISSEKEFYGVKIILSLYELLKTNYPIIDESEIDEKYKFKLWLENYIPDIDLDIILYHLNNIDREYDYILLCKKIFSIIHEEQKQEYILNKILESTGIIDVEDKYSKINVV